MAGVLLKKVHLVPTVDAHAHAQAFGSTGACPAQRGGIESPAGIRLRDGDGEIVGAAYDMLALAAEHDALVATGHLDGVSPLWRASTVGQAAELLNLLGGDPVVVSSEAGQAHNPSPPEALRSFPQALYEQGVAEAELRKALRDTPR
jgi:Family of unknown function (DUF6282)